MDNLASALSTRALEFENALDSLLPHREGDVLREAMRYAILGGGKRIRPFLVMEFGRLFGVDSGNVLNVALAIEVMHCYSLVHDDLPCMDDSDLRRGRASLHVAYDEATAILVGDGLQSLSFELLSRCEGRGVLDLVSLLSRSSGEAGMVGGQFLDISADVASIADLVRLQDLKTGCLFNFACESMAILGGVDDGVRARVRGYSGCLGLLFQMTDDLLDVGDSGVTGKVSGLDEVRGRVTWVSLLGVEGVRVRAKELCDEGKNYLSNFENVDLLIDLLDYLLVRKK